MGKMNSKKVLLSWGSGGSSMHQLIKEVLLKKFNNPVLAELADSARLSLRGRLAFSTDSFVVSPLFFPGGDIGKLAVCGTANDLVMLGASPEYLSLAFIVEEGLDLALLERITDSISLQTKASRIKIVTGDFKVVEKGACDKIFINTSGVGRIVADNDLSARSIRPHDLIIITGNIGRHGLSVLAKRKGLDFGFNIKSDCAALGDLLLPLLNKYRIKFMRDPTRGGVATTLNEIAQACSLQMLIEERNLPVSSQVKAAGELLGIEPLYIANEGIAVVICAAGDAGRVLSQLKRHPLGRRARIVGEVRKGRAGGVILKTVMGAQRLLDMSSGEALPRIC